MMIDDMTLFFVQGMLNVFLEWSLDSPKPKQIQNIPSCETLGEI